MGCLVKNCNGKLSLLNKFFYINKGHNSGNLIFCKKHAEIYNREIEKAEDEASDLVAMKETQIFKEMNIDIEMLKKYDKDVLNKYLIKEFNL